MRRIEGCYQDKKPYSKGGLLGIVALLMSMGLSAQATQSQQPILLTSTQSEVQAYIGLIVVGSVH
jgi:hypothetical protein